MDEPTHDIQIEDLEARDWESVIDRFTQDMDPWSVDIIKLADRYTQYLETREVQDLEIPARMIFVCAVLLRMKADLMQEVKDEPQPVQDEPMDEFEEEFDDMIEEEPVAIPDTTLAPKVQKKPKRRVSLDELKEALEKAMTIQERRKKRRVERQDMQEDAFIDLDEEDITDKLDQLMDRLTDIFSQRDDQVSFMEVVDRRDRQEKIETFTHILHLETDEKIECRQDEFFGDIEIRPGEQMS